MRAHPHKLWESVDELLGRGHTPTCSSVDVEAFSNLLMQKVEIVRDATSTYGTAVNVYDRP